MKPKESDILSYLIQSSATGGLHIVEGVTEQDDCAVLRTPQGDDFCVTTDFVRGTGFHLFKKGYLSFEDVGYYVVAANVSDLAAMGATPVCYLSVVRYSSERTFSEITSMLTGIANACREFRCPLVGGDSGSYEEDVLSGTGIGVVKSGRQLSRHTLQPSRAIFVSGDLGRPAAALAAVSNDVVANCGLAFVRALEKWRRPIPRIELGQALVETGLDISCMDVSDGLTASLQQLKRISGCGFDIEAAKIPIDPSVVAIANEINNDPVHLACSASVDFELLFSAPRESLEQIAQIGTDLGIPLAHIGYSTGTPDIRVHAADGSVLPVLPGVPWDHQVDDITEIFKRGSKS